VSILFYLPIGNLHPQFSSCNPPSFTRRIGTSLLASSTVMHYLLGSPRPEMSVNADFLPLYRTSLYRLRRSWHQIFGVQTPEIRCTEMPTTRDLAPSEPRYSRGQVTPTSTPMPETCRYPASPVTSPRCGPHCPRDPRNSLLALSRLPLAKSSAPFSLNSRYADPRV
jgi:hypothetical protein